MSSVNTCPTTPRSGRSPGTDSDWVSDRDGMGEKRGWTDGRRDKGAYGSWDWGV